MFESVSGIFGIAVIIGVFLVCRQFVCWYFKLSEIADLLREQKNLLTQISNNISLGPLPPLGHDDQER